MPIRLPISIVLSPLPLLLAWSLSLNRLPLWATKSGASFFFFIECGITQRLTDLVVSLCWCQNGPNCRLHDHSWPIGAPNCINSHTLLLLSGCFYFLSLSSHKPCLLLYQSQPWLTYLLGALLLLFDVSLALYAMIAALLQLSNRTMI